MGSNVQSFRGVNSNLFHSELNFKATVSHVLCFINMKRIVTSYRLQSKL